MLIEFVQTPNRWEKYIGQYITSPRPRRMKEFIIDTRACRTLPKCQGCLSNGIVLVAQGRDWGVCPQMWELE